MEENFKQVRLQDRQDQIILEKRHNTKVSIFIVVFFLIFLLYLYISNYCISVVGLKMKLFESQLRVLVFCLLKFILEENK